MALSEHEVSVRRVMYDDGAALQKALETVVAIRPRKCIAHDQPISDCYDMGDECDPKETVEYPGIMLQHFVLTAKWLVPGEDAVHDEKVYTQTVAPGMDMADTMGLLTVLEG